MYHRVTITSVTVDAALKFKQELISAGLVMDVDFVWRYQKADYVHWELISPDMVHFDIADPALATFYRLKWTRDN